MNKALPRQLSRRLALEGAQRLDDGAGGYSESWTSLGSHWTEIVPLSGRNSEHPGGSLAQQRYRISLRATPPGSQSRPKPGQRFTDGARIFHIETVTEADEQGRYLACRCTEELMQ